LGSIGIGSVDRTSGERLGTVELLRLRATLRPSGAEARRIIDNLFRLERPVDADALESLIGDEAVADLMRLAIARRVEHQIVPEVHFDRFGELLVASDLAARRRRSDFVAGPGPSSFLLAGSVRRPARGPILDLGAGSGIQGLLVGPADQALVAVDIIPRALAFTRFNAALNGRPRVDVRLGSFLDEQPDRRLDGRFATVIANPPFVLAPAVERTYRDRPLPGDLVGRRTVERVGRALRRGGRGYVVCNWIDHGGGWSDPVREWLAGSGLGAIVTRSITRSAAAYAERWTRDTSPAERPATAAAWAAALEQEGVHQIHFGVIALARPNRRATSSPRLTAVDALGQPASWPRIEALFAGSTAHDRGAR
jgi:methylase of polypeptide subunit release factors